MDAVITVRDLRNLELLDTGDVADDLNLSTSRIVQLERAGVLPALRTLGGRRIFLRPDVEALKRQRAAR